MNAELTQRKQRELAMRSALFALLFDHSTRLLQSWSNHNASGMDRRTALMTSIQAQRPALGELLCADLLDGVDGYLESRDSGSVTFL